MRKALIAILGVAVLAAFVLVGHQNTKAADHDEQAFANANEDIADVYAWVQGQNKINLVLTVPADAFSDQLQYVFHINSSNGLGTAQTETLLLCQFDAGTTTCWVGKAGSTAGGADFQKRVSGDASDPANPLVADDESLRVFAGLRDDPFFFNSTGFVEVVKAVIARAGDTPPLTFTNSCPDNLTDAVATTLVTQLGQGASGAAAKDDFAGRNVSALVIQVNKDLVNSGGDTLGVWASTNMR